MSRVTKSWLDRAVLALSPARGAHRIRAKIAAESLLNTQAGYDAAGKGERGKWWRGADSSQNSETRSALAIIRGRHRELARNNAYVAAAIDETVSLAIGDGLQPVAKGPKRRAKLAQRLMDEWAQSVFCDVDGRLDLFGLQALAMRTETESGEALVMRQMRRMPGTKVPLQLRILEGDYLDHLRDGTIEGRRVVMGVAFDAQMQRAGYYLHRNHPGDSDATRSVSALVPAADVAHVYEARRPGQVRGIPRAAPAMARVNTLDGFQDARLEQQRISACLAGLITQGEDGATKGDPLPDKLYPGFFGRLGPDESLATVTPPSVAGQGEFVSSEEHIIAKAYGLNHQVLTGNISGANFASSKIGRLDVYGNVGRWRRTMIIPQFCRTVERWFLEAAELSGHDLSGVTFDWVPPRSEILNLRDDIPALIKQARGGFGSLYTLLRSLGYSSPEGVLEEIAEVNKKLDELGLTLDSDPRKTTNGGQLQGASTPAPEPDPEDTDPPTPESDQEAAENEIDE